MVATARFAELPIRTEGHGEYHVNRFRIALKKTPNSSVTLSMLAHSLYNQFPAHLYSKYAEVEVASSENWFGKAIFRFTGMASLFGGMTRPADWLVPDNLHDDHVGVVQDDWFVAPRLENRKGTEVFGFTVQTLKRLYPTLAERAIQAATLLTLGGGLVVPASELIEVNRRHFLAGRRSWRIGPPTAFGYNPSVYRNVDYILETAAVERFSHRIYRTVSEKVLGLENFYGIPQGKVANIWCNLLMKFDTNNGGVEAVRFPSEAGLGWHVLDKVEYFYQEFAESDTVSMENSEVFVDIKRLHKEIY